MAFRGRLRDTVAIVSHCCFQEIIDDDFDDYVDDNDDNDDDIKWYGTPEPAIFQLFEPVATFSVRLFDEKEFPSHFVSMRKKCTYKILKKKKNDETDSSPKTAVSGCAHVRKSINFASMKKGLQKQVFGQCEGCANEALSSMETFVISETTTIYVCLQCGCQGCGISSPRRHASKHAEGSTSHALAINTTSWIVWCNECRGEIPVVQSKQLVKCMNHLQKIARVPSFDSFKGRNGSLTQKVMAWIGDIYIACFCKASVVVANQVATHLASVPAASSNVDSSQESKGPSGQKVMGLRNVGNTCFFNAAMQNLIQTYSLENLLMERSIEGGPLFLPGSDNSSTCSRHEDDYIKNLPSIRINLSKARPLTMELTNFLQEIKSAPQTNVVNPSDLFEQVCREVPMFRGKQQHDSHELLSHMLDIMRSEEIKRGQVAVLKYFELAVNSNPQTVDHDVRMKVKQYGRQVKHTFVDALFGGCLVSTVMCEECQYISQTLEPFLGLSLPVQDEKMSSLACLYNIDLVERKKECEEEEPDKVDDLIEVMVPEKAEMIGLEEEGPIVDDLNEEEYESKEDMVPVEWEKEGEKEIDKEEDMREDIVPVVLEYTGKEEKEDREEDIRDDLILVEGLREVEEEEKDMEKDVKDEMVHAAGEKEGEEEGDMDEDMNKDIVLMEVERKGEEEEVDWEENMSEDNVHMEGEYKGKEEHGYMDEDVKENMVPQEWKKEEEKDMEDAKDMKEEKSPDADIEENLERDIIKYSHSLEASMTSDSGCAENGVEPSQSPVHISTHISLSVLAENTATKDASVIYNLMPSGVAVWETGDADGPNKESPIANGEIHKSKVTLHVEYMNGTIANGYLASGDTNSEEPMEQLEAAASNIQLSSSYKHLGTGEQVISDVTSGTNTSSVSETGSSGFSQDMSLNMLYQSSEESEKVKDLDVPVNSSQSNVSDDTGISTQGTGSVDSATVGNNETPLKAENGEDVSISFNVQHMKPSEFEAPQPVRSRKEIWREGQRKSVSTLAPRYHSTSSECSLESCLSLFTSPELLTGNNKFGCKNCTKLKKKSNPNTEIKTVYSDASKKYLIIQPPAVLTLHLKRFEQFEVKKISKLDCHVDFPFVLDLAPYCSALCQNVKAGQKKILYSLYGVVEHKGGLKCGHYTAYVKVRPNIDTLTNFLSTHQVSVKEYLDQYAENVLKDRDKMEEETEEDNVSEIIVPPGQWFHISDSKVSKVTEATVKHAQAYMLFYERIY